MAGKLKAISSKKDYTLNDASVKNEIKQYTNFIPASEEIKEFTGPDYISLDFFIKMYIDMIDFELDEDLIWPYNWPINV